MSSMARRATCDAKLASSTSDVDWIDLEPDWTVASMSIDRIVMQLVTKTIAMLVVRNPPPDRVLESVS
jgi:hypothetical protein